MPSLSTLERACPPSRRRSCQACTKAKRRCDNGLPSCLRCTRRGIVCCYPVSSRVQNSTSGRATTEYTFQPVPNCELVLDMSPTLNIFTTLGSINDMDSLLSPEYSMLPATALPAPTMSILPMLSAYPSLERSLDTSLAMPAQDRSQISRNIASHLRYAIGIISQVPSQLVLRNRLPWCHHRFYQIHQNQTQSGQTAMPRSMQDAFSSCALYLAKNTTNTQVIHQCINSRLDDLLQSWPLLATNMAADLATNLTQNIIELVAYTQAILLYNIIAIFDTDMDARRVIEKTRDVLHSSAQKLEPFAFTKSVQEHSGSTTLSDSYTLQSTAWDDWVLAETARRTALIAHFFIHMYYHIIVGTPTSVCRDRARLESSRAVASDQEEKYWTVSSRLWEAENASEFAAARSDGCCQVARIYHMDDILAGCQSHAIATDVARDDFSRILVSSVLGIETYDRWMAGAGVMTR